MRRMLGSGVEGVKQRLLGAGGAGVNEERMIGGGVEDGGKRVLIGVDDDGLRSAEDVSFSSLSNAAVYVDIATTGAAPFESETIDADQPSPQLQTSSVTNTLTPPPPNLLLTTQDLINERNHLVTSLRMYLEQPDTNWLSKLDRNEKPGVDVLLRVIAAILFARDELESKRGGVDGGGGGGVLNEGPIC